MKRLLRLAVLVVIGKLAYELIQKQRSGAPMPAGAPFEPAPSGKSPLPELAPATATGAGDDLTRLIGIGPVYAGKLRDLGVTTFDGLAGADTETLAADLDVSTTMLANWQEQAAGLRP